MSDLIIGVIIGFIVGCLSGFLSGISVLKFQRRWEKSDKRKGRLIDSLKTHKKELVDILKELNQLKIKCDDFTIWKDSFNVCIDGLDDIKERIIYWQAEKHLKSYPDIYRLLDASIKKIDGDKNEIDGLNDELKGLKEYLSEKISDKFEGECNKLHSSIWCIMEGVKQSEKIEDSESLDKFLDGITITIKSETVYVDSSDGKNLAQMHCREVNVNDVKNFLSNLIKKYRGFREKIKSFTMGYKELNKTFKDFKNKLNVLLQDVEGDEDNLKGDCGKCLSWVKETG